MMTDFPKEMNQGMDKCSHGETRCTVFTDLVGRLNSVVVKLVVQLSKLVSWILDSV